MSTDAPSNLPPVLRPENPPARSLAELAGRFARETHGDLDGVSVSGITLATADLRAGEAFVAIRGVNRHGAEFARAAADKGAVAIVTDADGAAIAADAGLPILVVDNPRGMLGDLSAWVSAPAPTTICRSCSVRRDERQDERVSHPRGHPGSAGRRDRSVIDR